MPITAGKDYRLQSISGSAEGISGLLSGDQARDRQRSALEAQEKQAALDRKFRVDEATKAREFGREEFDYELGARSAVDAERMKLAAGLENEGYEFRISAQTRAKESELNEAQKRIETDPEWQGPDMAEARADALRQIDFQRVGLKPDKVLKEPSKYPEGQGPGKIWKDPTSGMLVKGKAGHNGALEIEPIDDPTVIKPETRLKAVESAIKMATGDEGFDQAAFDRILPIIMGQLGGGAQATTQGAAQPATQPATTPEPQTWGERAAKLFPAIMSDVFGANGAPAPAMPAQAPVAPGGEPALDTAGVPSGPPGGPAESATQAPVGRDYSQPLQYRQTAPGDAGRGDRSVEPEFVFRDERTGLDILPGKKSFKAPEPAKKVAAAASPIAQAVGVKPKEPRPAVTNSAPDLAHWMLYSEQGADANAAKAFGGNKGALLHMSEVLGSYNAAIKSDNYKAKLDAFKEMESLTSSITSQWPELKHKFDFDMFVQQLKRDPNIKESDKPAMIAEAKRKRDEQIASVRDSVIYAKPKKTLSGGSR